MSLSTALSMSPSTTLFMPPPTPLLVSPQTALREVLNASITSGQFADTKIYLFSHRNSAGDICKPKALYANSVVLRSVPYFEDLFSGNYSETATRDLDEDVTDEDAIAEHYGYDSDSDLEDAEDLKATEKPPLLRGHPFDPFCFGFASDENDSSESNGDDTADNGSQDTTRHEGDVPGYYEEKIEKGKVIKVQDVAFVTFQAFLFYLYTGHIEFAPFGSKANRKTRAAEIVSLAPDRVPRPSPKSMYRLADKYDNPALKSLSLEKIREGLGQCDAVRETFSRFTSHYPEMLGVHVKNLASVLTKTDSGQLQDQLDERLRAFADGEVDHASEAFSSLWRALITNSGGGGGKWESWRRKLGRRRNKPATVGTSLKLALIKSIRRGSFCDRKYHAKRTDAGNWQAPVYISSIVLGDVEPTLNTLIRGPRGGAGYSEDESDSDSDYEDALEGTSPSQGDMKPRLLEESEPEPVTTSALSIGAFSTWRALFFFLYTGEFEFAPLKSRESGECPQHVRKDSSPLPCSPKSICYLAGKLGIKYLEAVASENVVEQTSEKNVVREAFSKSTSRLPGVRELQWQLLVSSSTAEGITPATEEHIRGVAGGQTPHRYASLSLGFRLAVREKRKNPDLRTTSKTVPFPPGPTLQCANPNCSQKGIPMFVRDIGERIACQTCAWRLGCCVCASHRRPGIQNCGVCNKEWN